MSKQRFEMNHTWDQVGISSQLPPDLSQTQAIADAAQLGPAGTSWDYSVHPWQFRDLYRDTPRNGSQAGANELRNAIA
jgi:hypothetical protein